MEYMISIIVPVYNKEKTIIKALESVLNNKSNDYEIVIIDDGSTDLSGALVDKYAMEHGTNIRVIHQENQWVYAAFNNGIKAATGEYIYILNADDELYEGSIDLLIDLIDKYNHPDVIWTRCDMYQESDGNISITHMDTNNVLPKYYSSHDEMEDDWAYLYENRLIENQANLYKRTLALDHPFRNDVYAADGLFNLQIEPDICTSFVLETPVYKYYRSNDISENIANNRFYAYRHSMNNELYAGQKNIFTRKSEINNHGLKVLSQWRIDNFWGEFFVLFSEQCSYSLEKKVGVLINEYYDSIVKESAVCLGIAKELEGRILFYLRGIITNNERSELGEYYIIYEIIKGLMLFDKSDSDYEKLEAAIYNSLNMNNLGGLFWEELKVN